MSDTGLNSKRHGLPSPCPAIAEAGDGSHSGLIALWYECPTPGRLLFPLYYLLEIRKAAFIKA